LAFRQANYLTANSGPPILDHVFPVPDDDEPPAGVRELANRSDGTLVEDLAAIGVYVTDRLIVAPPDEDMNPRLVLQGIVGDFAFSDQILRPQALDDSDVLADIEHATATAEYETIRARLLNGADD
jgi:hypothetical protein